ncbi:zinc finger Ran-binding domain-containing protein 2-like isoform X1 [Cimex lectularius]|uniref:Zinc finger Ran-binding domain-containing protein 2 n=1 Tax=Cimex lectularius TaxID=79782 RepID=A0A8I6RPM6_CIMLE|nr:zinc finger Ran-binding domain-containing protein 2-like isoform X1 [Cimex lectularius]
MTEVKDAEQTKFQMSEGDWICTDPHCGNINFAWRNKCNRCNKDRIEGPVKKKLGQEIGKALAEKSRGLFSADDWQCNKCGNVNWARRQQCNMCNAPKFGEIEERTGYGGGYNDRGVVEYVKRDDSDNEYDEFGRRKKNKTSITEEEHRRSEEEEEEEEDDDDDEGDNNDLSKYDLSSWGDENEEQKTKDLTERSNETRKNDQRSRSRSRSPSKYK